MQKVFEANQGNHTLRLLRNDPAEYEKGDLGWFLEIDGRPRSLSKSQMLVLASVLQNNGLVASVEKTFATLYPFLRKEETPDQKIVDVFICKMRRQLGPVFGPMLRTVWGRGHVWTNERSSEQEITDLVDITRQDQTAYDVNGISIGLSDLPPAGINSHRWVTRRKANVVLAVQQGLITQSEAKRWYRLSADELDEWLRKLTEYGLQGLRSTRFKIYQAEPTV